MTRPRFLRSDTVRHSRLGKNRKKLQKWRRPRGRHSKIRRKRFGYPVKPSVGYRTARVQAGKVNGMTPVLVHTLRDLESLAKGAVIIVARIGAKKKIELLKYAREKQLHILNVSNPTGGAA